MVVLILLLAHFTIGSCHLLLLHHNVLSVAICLWSPMACTESGIRVLIRLIPCIFGVLVLEVLIWILIVDFFRHLAWRWLLKLLRVHLLNRLSILWSHYLLVLLEHLIVALYLLLVRDDVLLGGSRTGITVSDMPLILVIFM
jgi:hypothetical protein